jgi:hypothetical protein
LAQQAVDNDAPGTNDNDDDDDGDDDDDDDDFEGGDGAGPFIVFNDRIVRHSSAQRKTFLLVKRRTPLILYYIYVENNLRRQHT